MIKETFYFSHDYDSRSDEKIKKLIRKHGMTGYGIYWSIIEDLYMNANALEMDCEGIAYDMRVGEETVMSILKDFDLFVFDGGIFGSTSIERRLEIRADRSKKASKAANKRWEKHRRKKAEESNIDANAMQMHSDRNAIKERKLNKIIYIKSVSSPPEGVDALHFYLAKGYHKMFYDYKKSKSLEQAELHKWVNTIRLLIEVDKVPITQLIAIKKFLEAGINNERGVDTFWCETIFSISAFRKKSKDGTYHIDRIKQAAKKWLSRNPEKESLVYKAEQLLMSRVNG